MKFKVNKNIRMRSSGFTLIEVMVTVFILAVGVLGMAGLQAIGVKESQNTYFRTQADILINDMADRMRANRPASRDEAASPYVYDGVAVTASCGGACSSPADMADQDLNEWSATIIASGLPNASAAITRADAAGSIYQLQIFWDEGRTQNGTCNAGNVDASCVRLELVVQI